MNEIRRLKEDSLLLHSRDPRPEASLQEKRGSAAQFGRVVAHWRDSEDSGEVTKAVAAAAQRTVASHDEVVSKTRSVEKKHSTIGHAKMAVTLGARVLGKQRPALLDSTLSHVGLGHTVASLCIQARKWRDKLVTLRQIKEQLDNPDTKGKARSDLEKRYEKLNALLKKDIAKTGIRGVNIGAAIYSLIAGPVPSVVGISCLLIDQSLDLENHKKNIGKYFNRFMHGTHSHIVEERILGSIDSIRKKHAEYEELSLDGKGSPTSQSLELKAAVLDGLDMILYGEKEVDALKDEQRIKRIRRQYRKQGRSRHIIAAMAKSEKAALAKERGEYREVVQQYTDPHIYLLRELRNNVLQAEKEIMDSGGSVKLAREKGKEVVANFEQKHGQVIGAVKSRISDSGYQRLMNKRQRIASLDLTTEKGKRQLLKEVQALEPCLQAVESEIKRTSSMPSHVVRSATSAVRSLTSAVGSAASSVLSIPSAVHSISSSFSWLKRPTGF